MSPEQRSLLDSVEEELRLRGTSTKAWSFAHYGALYSAAVTSAVSALILKIEFLGLSQSARSDWAAILAGLAALLGLIAGIGNFESKWRINRRTRGQLKRLRIQLKGPTPNLVAVRKKFEEVVGDVEEEIAALRDDLNDR